MWPRMVSWAGRRVPSVRSWALSRRLLGWLPMGKWLPTRLLARPVGSLPQYAVPWKAPERGVVLGRLSDRELSPIFQLSFRTLKGLPRLMGSADELSLETQKETEHDLNCAVSLELPLSR
jgi:hypothetical protein